MAVLNLALSSLLLLSTTYIEIADAKAAHFDITRAARPQRNLTSLAANVRRTRSRYAARVTQRKLGKRVDVPIVDQVGNQYLCCLLRRSPRAGRRLR